MSKLFLVAILFGCINIAQAINAPSSLTGNNAFDGNKAYMWSVGVAAPNINSASITFTDVKMTAGGSGGNRIIVDFGSFVGINNIKIANGNPSTTSKIGKPPDNDPTTTIGNVKTITDNDAYGDAFANIPSSKITQLGIEAFPTLNVYHTWTYVFSAAQLLSLNAYIAVGNWGFEIDPDCHFTVGSISFNYTQRAPSVPDTGGTFALLGLTILGILAVRRKLCLN